MTPQILDGTLLAAIDVTWGDTQPAGNVTGVDTVGDASRLRDIRRGFDLACLVDPAQVPAVFADVEHDAAAAVQEQHAHLDSFEILAGPGGLHVNLVASNSKGTAQVAFDLVPTLTSEEFEHWKEVLRFSTENIVVHIEPGAGAKVLEILTLGIGIGYVDMEAESMRGNIEREIEVKGQSKPRNGQFTLPKTHKPKISTRIESYEITETNVFIGISLTAHLGRYQLWGDSARYAVNGRASVHVGETLVVPYDVFRDDPRLRVRWVVQRLDTNEPVDVVDEAGRLSYRAQLPFDSPEPPPLNVSCRAYLMIGTASQEPLQPHGPPGPERHRAQALHSLEPRRRRAERQGGEGRLAHRGRLLGDQALHTHPPHRPVPPLPVRDPFPRRVHRAGHRIPRRPSLPQLGPGAPPPPRMRLLLLRRPRQNDSASVAEGATFTRRRAPRCYALELGHEAHARPHRLTRRACNEEGGADRFGRPLGC